MKLLVFVASGSVLALAGLMSPALAADMPEYPIIETPEPLPLPAAGGWYLRGDIGYKAYSDPNADFDETGYEPFWGESLDDTAVIGAGVGYQFNSYLRMDATLDYEFKSTFEGNLNCRTPCVGGGAGFSQEAADIDAWSGLVNAYVDLGTWYGFTPYVGAGIGASYLTTSNVRTVSAPTAEYDGDGTWNFAWALMAGTSFRMTENLLLDINYRYMNLGDAKSDTIPTFTSPLEYNDIEAHEVRVGLRYNLF